MKYIELVKGLFTTDHETRAKQLEPYVAYSKEANSLMFTIAPEPYVTFTAEEGGGSIGLAKLSTNQTLEYSTDTTTWNTFDTTTNVSLNTGDKVYVRGILIADNTAYNRTQFKMMGRIASSGNCNALWNYQDLNAPLKVYCGYKMFENCTSLTKAPELPATELAKLCYYEMFRECNSLTTSPEILPATTLVSSCYKCMFFNCSALMTAPELPATTLTNSCYYGMFKNCTSLTAVPELPAAVLTSYCYYEMFKYCAKLDSIICLATDISKTTSTGYWVYDVASTGTFIKHPDMNEWNTGESGIPNGWEVVDAEP